MLKNTTAEQFVESLLGKNEPGQLPLVCTIDITEGCNLACRHCLISTASRSRRTTMSASAFDAATDILREAGVLCLVITGGEPLTHPEFTELWSCAAHKGFLMTLFTNATLVDNRITRFLAAHTPRRIEASMYGATAATYKRVTGIAGSLERFQRGVRLLQQSGLNLHLKYPVMKSNMDEWKASQAWAEARHLPWRKESLIVPRLDGDVTPLRERVPETDRMDEAAARDADCQAEGEQHPPTPGDRNSYLCGAGTRTLHVDVRGHANPCVLWRHDPLPLSAELPRLWATHCAVAHRKCRERQARRPSPRASWTCPALIDLEATD